MYDIVCSVLYVCYIHRCAISTRTGACMLCNTYVHFVHCVCVCSLHTALPMCVASLCCCTVRMHMCGANEVLIHACNNM